MDVSYCGIDGRGKQTAVCDLHGTLVGSKNVFPFFLLVAFETGFLLRPLLLLLCFPVLRFLQLFVSEGAALQLLIFITFSGLKSSTVEFISKAVLAKFYLEDMLLVTFTAFLCFGNKFVVSEVPRIMVESFLKEYLGIDGVIGSELQITKRGYCTGLLHSNASLLTGSQKLQALKEFFKYRSVPDAAFGDDTSDFAFASWAKEGYVVRSNRRSSRLPREMYPRPLVFHDGRLVVLPTFAMGVTIFLWAPLGVTLALLRIFTAHLPYGYSYPFMALLGVTVRVSGSPPSGPSGGNLYVCAHRTLLDPVFLAGVLQRRLTAVTYGISRLSELLANIPTVRLGRTREGDGRTLRSLLDSGKDVVVCPEGTTCREPYLLRFSPLFAEVASLSALRSTNATSVVVPVALDARANLFHGTTARGWKCLDPLFFCMNPSATYDVCFLKPLPREMSCAAGRTSVEVANHVQALLAAALGFQCTQLTRKDKYTFLAGHDGKL